MLSVFRFSPNAKTPFSETLVNVALRTLTMFYDISSVGLDHGLKWEGKDTDK